MKMSAGLAARCLGCTLGLLALGGGTGSCGSRLPIEGAPCPCPRDGYVCDLGTDRCVSTGSQLFDGGAERTVANDGGGADREEVTTTPCQPGAVACGAHWGPVTRLQAPEMGAPSAGAKMAVSASGDGFIAVIAAELEVWVTRYTSSTATFEIPVRLSAGFGLNDNAMVAVADGGGAIVAWENGRGQTALLAREFSKGSGQAWHPVEVAQPFRPAVIQTLRALAMTPDGQAVVSWTSTDETVPDLPSFETYLRIRESTMGWQAPVRVTDASALADWLHVDIANRRQYIDVVAAWTVYDMVRQNTDVMGAVYEYDHGDRSGALGPAETLAAGSDTWEVFPEVHGDGAGNAFVKIDSYRDSEMVGGFLSRHEAGLWTTTPMSEDGEPIAAAALSVGRGGDAVLLFERCQLTCQVSARRFSGGAWLPSQPLSSPDLAPDRHELAVAVDGTGHAIAMWTEYTGANASLVVTELDPRGGWSPPHSLLDAPGFNDGLAAAFGPQGIGIVTWVHQDAAGDVSLLAAAYQ
jgi:hypothetical protein